MTIQLIVDKPEILEKIKKSNPTVTNYDDFYHGLNFILETQEVPNIDIFGCWNSNCTDKFNYSQLGSQQQKTLSEILKSYDEKFPNKNKMRFLLGDNIYYDKKLKETKTNYEEKLNSMTINDDKIEFDGINFVQLAKDLIDNGIKCFTDVPSFMVLGNHDVVFPFILQYQIYKCFSELQINGNIISFGNWIMPNAFYSIKINIGNLSILFVIIDTNLLESDEYINFFPKDKKDEYVSRMVVWLEKTLKENESSIKIVMGHIPIFFYSHIKEKKEKKKEEGEKEKEETKEKKEKKKEEGVKEEKKEKKEKTPVQSRYKNVFLNIYEIMIKYNVTTYMCADEHNMQVLQDLDHGINHIICGASPGGGGSDEAFNLDVTNLYFSNKHIIVPELEIKFNKKIIINAPSFTNLIIHPSLLQFNIISSSELNLHHKEEYCKNKNCVVSNSNAQIYDIITIPKYRDLIAVYDCNKFNEKFCS
jgi:hypothetical protein